EGVADLAVEATEVRGQEVLHHVVRAHRVRVVRAERSSRHRARGDYAHRHAGEAGGGGAREGRGLGLEADLGADTVGAERIEHGQVPEGRDIVTTQADLTPAASQARGGTATELQAGGIAVVRAQG